MVISKLLPAHELDERRERGRKRAIRYS